ncbi:HIT-like protein [Polychaeton citri CBS 116435]|uniref:HIT-like protein n=1 Tax=Polychaeton citri CBS 116435 TaxID=1314669 RepID=A0A9P4Q0M5_9PEZI|nr:HIT-like protein [Polychaeton citri CBS 116435]
MASLEDKYPVDCPFCRIAQAYPVEQSPVPSDPAPDRLDPQCYLILNTRHVMAFLDIYPIAPGHILLTTRDHYRKLSDLNPPPPPRNTDLATPSSQLDWQTQRSLHHSRDSARELGVWLTVLSRALCAVTGIEDWNIVQNNGERAAQVVPHIHFHFIPRYQEGRRENAGKGKVDVGMLKSWRMFGRGAREDLDEEEGAELAALLREAVRKELAQDGSRIDNDKAKL